MHGLEMYFQLDPTGGHCRTEEAGQADVHVTTLNMLHHVLSQLLPVAAVGAVPDPATHLVATKEQLGLHNSIQV